MRRQTADELPGAGDEMRGSVMSPGRGPGPGWDTGPLDSLGLPPGVGGPVVGASGEPESQDAMNGQTLQHRVVIISSQGLHLRPATAFAERARQFQCAVTV